jgi:hypothetical protein
MRDLDDGGRRVRFRLAAGPGRPYDERHTPEKTGLFLATVGRNPRSFPTGILRAAGSGAGDG